MVSINPAGEAVKKARFSLGIMHVVLVWMVLIPHTMGKYRHAVKTKTNVFGCNEKKKKLEEEAAKRAIYHAALEAIVFFTFVVVATAVVVPLLTKSLDERMVDMVEAFSRLLSGILLGALSIRVACWLNVYFRRERALPANRIGTSLKELKFRVRWNVSKKFLRYYYCLLILFQGSDAVTIPVSIIAGLAFGFFLDYVVYKMRRMEPTRQLRKIGSICLIGFLALCSLFELIACVVFVANVWDSNDEEGNGKLGWPIIGYLVLVPLFPTMHFVYWRVGEKQRKQAISQRQSMVKHPMMMSMYMSSRRQKDPAANSSEDDPTTIDNTDPHQPVIARAAKEEEMDSVNTGKKNEIQEAPLENGNDDDDHENNATEVELEEENKLASRDEDEGDAEDGTNEEVEEVKEDGPPPTYWELMMDWQWCGCVRGGEDQTAWGKFWASMVWFFYILVCICCIFSLFNNVGATAQQEGSRDKMPFVHEVLYDDINNFPVCAFDNRTADWTIPRREWTVQPTTFDNKTAAHDAGYLILHCGACGACSDWHNLELEYTTRYVTEPTVKCIHPCSISFAIHTYLLTPTNATYDLLSSEISLPRKAKHVLPGPCLECLEEPTIGFRGGCAICWADDIECTKTFCWQIGIQSFFINTLANFEVGEDTITAAGCEEANCEAGNPGHFVECSGATRRRMDVTSSIERPESQRCMNVDVDWEEMFPDRHPNEVNHA